MRDALRSIRIHGFWTWRYLRQQRRRHRAAGCLAAKPEFCGMSLCGKCRPVIEGLARKAREAS